MPESKETFQHRLLGLLADEAIRWVRPYLSTKSKTLAESLTKRFDLSGPSRVDVYLPHYWAVYVHDGRKPFSKQKFMLWFRDPKDDPRLRGGYPVRRSGVRRLSRRQFYYWLQKNKEALAAGEPPPMIVTKVIRKATPPTRFFENDGGMKGFPDRAGEIVKREFSQHVKETLGDLLHIDARLDLRL